ncbi:MAG: carboxy terminal-processing peptidase [Cyclobacteriaceae bacterium]|nr:carboxy terminal-processing peptidase [Cyclobacteriaceae bacterium]
MRNLVKLFYFIILFPHLLWAGITPVDTVFTSKPVYGRQARVIIQILESSHYRKLKFNDSLSSAVLDSYIATLDNQRSYFLKSDIDAFNKYRFQLDDLTRIENVDPAFGIYEVFKKRFAERMDYVLTYLINQEFDFSKDEYYEVDRENAPWAETEKELNQIWTLAIKNQALSLKVAGKSTVEIQETLRSRYERFVKSIKQTNSEDVFGYYMNAITEAYDPHTNYFSPRRADLFKQSMSQSLEGIGARLQTENDYTKVVEILPGGPAEKTKLVNVNDRIIGVAQGDEGEMVDVIGWRIDDVVKLIKGPKGTKVRLTILPAETGVTGPSVVVTLIRDKIKLEDLTAKKKVIDYVQNGRRLKLGVITLPSFYFDWEAYQKGDPNYNSTTKDIKRLIAELQKEGIDGLAIDLRNNGGGSLEEAINLTGLFIKTGPVVQVKDFTNRTEIKSDDDPAIVYTGPLIVLINRFSASASEIFAGAIQDYHRGVVVGESSFGKGTVQSIIELDRYVNYPKEEVGSLKLTFQKFYRVTGHSTQFKGVTPDIKFPTALTAEQFGERSSKSALPWDEIRSTMYQKTPLINDAVLKNLIRSHQERLKTDPSLIDLVAQTEETRKNLAQNRISLNEEVRRKEMEESEKRRNSRKPGDVKIDREGQNDNSLLKLEDQYLREGLLVLTDLIVSKIG